MLQARTTAVPVARVAATSTTPVDVVAAVAVSAVAPEDGSLGCERRLPEAEVDAEADGADPKVVASWGKLRQSNWLPRQSAKTNASSAAIEGACHGSASTQAATSSIMEALAHDNTVMECNLRDYDVALRSAMLQVLRLRMDAAQMEAACGQLGQLQELVSREMRAHAQLREENVQLLEKHYELTSVIRRALETHEEEDAESAALIKELTSENSALRALLGFAEPAAVLAAAPCLDDEVPPQMGFATPQRVPSIGSSVSTPSRGVA